MNHNIPINNLTHVNYRLLHYYRIQPDGSYGKKLWLYSKGMERRVAQS